MEPILCHLVISMQSILEVHLILIIFNGPILCGDANIKLQQSHDLYLNGTLNKVPSSYHKT